MNYKRPDPNDYQWKPTEYKEALERYIDELEDAFIKKPENQIEEVDEIVERLRFIRKQNHPANTQGWRILCLVTDRLDVLSSKLRHGFDDSDLVEKVRDSDEVYDAINDISDKHRQAKTKLAVCSSNVERRSLKNVVNSLLSKLIALKWVTHDLDDYNTNKIG